MSGTEPSLIDDLPAIREQLLAHWRSIADDLIARGFRPQAVFETLLAAGLAGCAGIEGSGMTAERLARLAAELSARTREEEAALAEARRHTKN